MKANPAKFRFNSLRNTDSHTLQIGDVSTKSVSSVTLLDVTIDLKLNFKEYFNNVLKKHIINYIPQKAKKVSHIRKSQNRSLLSDRKSICLLRVNLDVLPKNRYAKS